MEGIKMKELGGWCARGARGTHVLWQNLLFLHFTNVLKTEVNGVRLSLDVYRKAVEHAVGVRPYVQTVGGWLFSLLCFCQILGHRWVLGISSKNSSAT